MFEVKTILLMNITACFLLAVSLRAAISRPLRESSDGLWLWLVSLVAQALAYSLMVFSERASMVLYQVVAQSVLATFLTLQAAALFQFFGRRLQSWWHLVPAFLVVVLVALADGSRFTLTILAGVMFGSAYVVLALVASQLGRSMQSAGLRLMVVGFSLGALAFFVRALPVLHLPYYLGGVQAPERLMVIGLFLSFMVIILTSVGFLVLQKDRAEQAATKLAVTDPLTGTFNRRTFLDLAEKEIARARRSQAPLSLVMFDLDHFKKVNDRYGHVAGDYVLKRFVEVTQLCLRQEDLLVRYGGEEFCLLLPDTDVGDAVALAERIRAATEYAMFIFDEGQSEQRIHVTVSGGVAKLGADARIDTLVARADEALYAAKNAGRNQIAVAPDDAITPVRLVHV